MSWTDLRDLCCRFSILLVRVSRQRSSSSASFKRRDDAVDGGESAHVDVEDPNLRNARSAGLGGPSAEISTSSTCRWTGKMGMFIQFTRTS